METKTNMANVWQELMAKYHDFVIGSPTNASHAETALKVISYLSPVRGEYSAVVSELLLCCSNLLSLLNDAILRRAAQIHLDVPVSVRRLKTFLSIIENVEVFIEIASFTVGGDVHRWFVLVLVQIIKASLRFLLLLKHKAGIYQSPPLPALKRGCELKERIETRTNSPDQEMVFEEANQLGQVGNPLGGATEGGTFTLSSGRVIRKLEATPPMNTRTWKIQDPKTKGGTVSSPYISLPPTEVNHRQLCGESLHILRPLAHLISMFHFGQASWKPFFLACGFDISSLYLLGDKKDYNIAERNELRRRVLMMAVYILRSPFYDEYSKKRLLYTLKLLSSSIPGASIIMNPIIEYLPWWQKMYSYVWVQ